ncbi:MAG TPA: CHASE domain-containing protein [Verrucomicrobiae bacterium]|jgi:PAS domain S-box-containing protein|nr:CHASE domain-containing protein [Verrucomicrobiae bacterium]
MLPEPRRWLPVAVLLAGLGLTVFATYYAARSVQLRRIAALDTQAQEARAAIETRLESYIALLRGMAGYFAAETNVSSQSFAAYVDRLRLDKFYPGIQGIGYSHRVQPDEAAALESLFANQGWTNFHIWPDSPRSEYHSIIFLEPPTRRNLAAMGYDMFTDPVRRDAMERARDTGQPAASGKVSLVQEIDNQKQPGFLVYTPVYANGVVPESVPERRERLKGFVYCPLRMGDFLETALRALPMPTMEIQIYDGTPSPENLLNIRTPPGQQPAFGEQEQFSLTVAGRPWTIVLREPSLRVSGWWIAPLVLLGGALLSLLFFYLTLSEASARRRAEETAARLRASENALRQSETRLRLILENVRDHAIFSMDLNGIVTSWNSGAERLFGFTDTEAVGKSGAVIFTPEDRDSHAPEEEMRLALENGFSGDDRWHQRKDGSRLFVSGVVRPMDDEFGNRVGFIKVARDITDRLMAQEQIRKEKEFSETIINSLPGVFYLFDEHGNWLRWNENLEKVTGYSGEEMRKHLPWDFVDPQDRPRVDAGLRQVMESGSSSLDAEIVTRDGRRIPHLFFGRRIILDERTCVVGMGVDISERKRAEQELRDAEERLRNYTTELELRVAERTAHLRQSIQSLESLLYHVAHDLRGPLRAMASFTKILLDEYASGLDERAQDYAQRISTASHFMDELVQDLLAYGHLTHSQMELSTVSLEHSVNAVLEQLADEIQTKGARVVVEHPLPSVKGNAAVLKQIILNLVVNALKFVPTDRTPEIRIRAERNQRVRLWVGDNGIGIKPEYHERIFRVFERLHGGNEYPGTGIGLAIVAKGVERLGGTAGVESKLGDGSRFWIELPCGD